MKLRVAIGDVAEAEERLAESLLEVGERHRADHDVHHLTRRFARWAQGHVAALEPFGARYGTDVDASVVGEQTRGPLAGVRERAAVVVGRRPEAGLLLLRDVRELHLLAAEASIDWTILAQAAQAAKDTELVECVSRCHPETLRIVRWTVTKLKEAAPQVLTV